MMAENVNWSGQLKEPEFLARLFDLNKLPSDDHRFNDAFGDIRQHRTYNSDWENDWIFYDRRFNLLHADDEAFLNFLCETIHPDVRPDATAAKKLCELYNRFLRVYGFELAERTRISGKTVYIGRLIGASLTAGLASARKKLVIIDVSYVAQQVARMESAVDSDPELAIGTAKELVETVCKTVLDERREAYSKTTELPELVKQTAKILKLTPDDIPNNAKAAHTIKRLLSNLGAIPLGIAELRNQYGTGHGKRAGTKGLTPRHARLAVGAASTLAVFFIETHREADGFMPRGREASGKKKQLGEAQG
jgi:hypothetical protein